MQAKKPVTRILSTVVFVAKIDFEVAAFIRLNFLEASGTKSGTDGRTYL